MKATFAILKRLLASNRLSFLLTAIVTVCATSSGDVVLSNGNYSKRYINTRNALNPVQEEAKEGGRALHGRRSPVHCPFSHACPIPCSGEPGPESTSPPACSPDCLRVRTSATQRYPYPWRSNSELAGLSTGDAPQSLLGFFRSYRFGCAPQQR